MAKWLCNPYPPTPRKKKKIQPTVVKREQDIAINLPFGERVKKENSVW